MLCLATLGATAFTSAKTPSPQTRAAVSMQIPKHTPPRQAAGQRSMWFAVDEPPVNEPSLSCYLDPASDTWLCAYDADLAVDPEDSW